MRITLCWLLLLFASEVRAGEGATLCADVRDTDDKVREWTCRAVVDNDASACRRISSTDWPVRRVLCEVLRADVLDRDTSTCGSLEALGRTKARTARVDPKTVDGELRAFEPLCKAWMTRDSRRCLRVAGTADRQACEVTVAALKATDDAWVVVQTPEPDDLPVVRIDAEAWRAALEREGLLEVASDDPYLHPKEPAPQLGAFRAQWKDQLVFPFSQGAFLSASCGDVGVCQAMAMDWIRDRADGGPGFGRDATGGPGRMTEDEFTAMEKRMAGLKALQAELDDKARSGDTRKGPTMNAAVASDPSFEDICFRDVSRSWIPIGEDTTGDTLFAAVLKQVQKCSVGRFVLNLHGTVDPVTRTAEGHAMAIDITDGGFRVMDPNVGTFHFDEAQAMLAWAKQLYAALYQGRYRGCSLTADVG